MDDGAAYRGVSAPARNKVDHDLEITEMPQVRAIPTQQSHCLSQRAVHRGTWFVLTGSASDQCIHHFKHESEHTQLQSPLVVLPADKAMSVQII